jgi:hypothetical protein
MASKINFKNLMAKQPTEYCTLVNSKGQTIVLCEHPTRGDEEQVIVFCRELEMAAYSGFYDTEDLTASHREYEPSFDEDGQLWIGDFTAE